MRAYLYLSFLSFFDINTSFIDLETAIMPPFKALRICTALAFLVPHVWCGVSTNTVIEACLTKYCTISPKSVGSTTTYYTIHQSETCVYTTTPTSTVQPKPATTTVQSTAMSTVIKTLPASNLGTFSTTTTVIDSNTVTNTITATAYATQTVSVTVSAGSTTTIATTASLVPLSQGQFDKRKHERVAGARSKLLSGARPQQKQKRNTASTYPTSVTCDVLFDVITGTTKVVIASKTATVTNKPSTITKTSVTTQTVTSTYLPITASTTTTLSTTVEVTTTVQATTTTTSTVSITVTVQAPQSTFYAACASNNVIDQDPSYFSSAQAQDNYAQLATDTPYDCCVACNQSPGNCDGGFFQDRLCTFLEPAGTCEYEYDDIFLFEAGDQSDQL